MRVLGLSESALAWPDKNTAVALVGGCNLSCRYCNSYALVLYPKKFPVYDEKHVLEFLESRKLKALLLSGGEPLIQEGLKDFLKSLKDKGIETGIQTNGTYPELLRELISKKLVSFVSLDIKTVLRPREYSFLTGYDRVQEVKRSLALLKKGLVDYEVNLTHVPGYIREEDFGEIASQIGKVKRFVLNEFCSKPGCMDPGFECIPFSPGSLVQAAVKLCQAGIGRIVIRKAGGEQETISSAVPVLPA